MPRFRIATDNSETSSVRSCGVSGVSKRASEAGIIPRLLSSIS